MIQKEQILKDNSLQAHYDEQGYVILTLHNITMLDDLERIVTNTNAKYDAQFYYSMLSFSKEKNLELQQALAKVLKSYYSDFFVNYMHRNESFLVKPASLNEEMALHQDWSFTDYKKFNMGTFWLPLQDVNELNGCMTMLPKSHKWGNSYISNSYLTARIPSIELEGTVSLNLKKGEVLFFNPSVFHGSFPNLSSLNRIVVTAQIFNEKAPYLYFEKKDEVYAKVYKLEEDDLFFKMRDLIEGRLDSFEMVEEIKYQHQEITASKLLKDYSK